MGSAQQRNFAAPQPVRTVQPSARRVLLAGLALLALYSVPLFSAVLPPLFDYPNHLARFAILATGGNEFYEVRWAPLPNLAGDVIVPLLARAMPLVIAGKLFLVMIFALILGGTAWLNRAVSGAWRFWPLLAAAFLYNLQLRWGFLNYLFGLGLALCGAALWLTLERARLWRRLAASTVAALLCFFSHISAFGIYALIVTGIEAQPAFAEWRAGKWRALRRRAVVLAAQFLFPITIALISWRPGIGGKIVYWEFSYKLTWLFGIFYNYIPIIDFVSFFLMLALFGGLAARRRLNFAPRIVPAILLIFAAYLVVPTEMLSAWATDQRIIIAFFFLLVAAAAPEFPNRRTACWVGAAALVIMLARLGIVEAYWLEANRVYAADLAAIDALPLGSKLAVAHPKNALNAAGFPEVHLPALASVRREAFVPTLFTFTGQQPIALKPPYDRLAAAADRHELWTAFTGGDNTERQHALEALAEFDAIVFVAHEPFQLPREDCLRPLFRRPTFQIYTLVHGGDCPEQR
jgi:hypothetical protein